MVVVWSRLFDLFTILWSLLFVPFIPTLFQLRRDPALVRRFSRAWAAGMLWGMARLVGLRHEIVGDARPGARPALLVANHQSLWETIAFTVLEPNVSIVAKRSLLRIPFFGWYLRRYPMIFIDRDKPGANARRLLREARAAIADGRSVLIFPEGTRVPVDERRPFQPGLQLLLRGLDCDVVPIVHNSGLFVDDRRNLKRAGVVLVEYLPPIARGNDPGATAAALEAAINDGKDRLAAAARLAGDVRPRR